jgi:hypothetical protein
VPAGRFSFSARNFERHLPAPRAKNRNTTIMENRKEGGEKEQITYSVQLDLIERELKNAQENVSELRTLETNKKAAKGKCQMLRAALGNARHSLRELENILE